MEFRPWKIGVSVVGLVVLFYCLLGYRDRYDADFHYLHKMSTGSGQADNTSAYTHFEAFASF